MKAKKPTAIFIARENLLTRAIQPLRASHDETGVQPPTAVACGRKSGMEWEAKPTPRPRIEAATLAEKEAAPKGAADLFGVCGELSA
jgi:hypothetical protein